MLKVRLSVVVVVLFLFFCFFGGGNLYTCISSWRWLAGNAKGDFLSCTVPFKIKCPSFEEHAATLYFRYKNTGITKSHCNKLNSLVPKFKIALHLIAFATLIEQISI